LNAVDEESDKVIGYICGAKDGYQKIFNKSLIPVGVTAILLRPYLIFHKRFAILFAMKLRLLFSNKKFNLEELNSESKLPQPMYDVTAFAMSPEIKAKGYGYFLLDFLMKNFINEVVKIGGGSIRATVWRDNNSMIQFYKNKKWITLTGSVDNPHILFYNVVK
jgi:hypothetical protein